MRKDSIQLILLIIGGLVYSIVSWAYISSTFVSKDMFTILYDEIKYVRSTVDDIKLHQTKENK